MMMADMQLLPLVCLLTCSAAASADGNEPVKVIVMEDRDAILPCSLGSNIQSTLFDWKKDGSKEEIFFYNAGVPRQSEQFRGRVSHFPDELKNGNASIKITETKLTDGGNYTCIFPRLRPERKFNVELVVGAAPKPSVKILKTDHGPLLQCEVLGASPKPQLQWQDSDGNVVPAEDPQISERGGSYDVILQATVTKIDTYRCVVTQKEINHQTYDETYGPPIGAALEPSVTILKTEDGSLLQCFVRGASPKPQLQWQDSDGNEVPAKDPQISERGGSYDVILQATVTKTDTYRCVVTQTEINHQTQAEIYVTPIEASSSSTGWIVAGVCVILLLITVLVIWYCKRQKDSLQEKYERTIRELSTADSIKTSDNPKCEESAVFISGSGGDAPQVSSS